MPAPLTRTEKALDALYSELPTIACQGHCQASCAQIDNAMTRAEQDRIEKRTGRPLSGLSSVNKPCSLLTRNGHCSVYMSRPTICRLWGVVESMKCPWGCTPEPRYLSHDEGHAFLRRADELGGSLA